MTRRLNFSSPAFRSLVLLSFLAAFFTSTVALSASISKVKGKGVLIEIEEDDDIPEQGDIYVAIDSKGKKRGIIRITKVKGERAVGRLTKGKARKGWTLRSRSDVVAESQEEDEGEEYEEEEDEDGEVRRYKKAKRSVFAGGALVGLNLSSMDVTLNNGTTTAPLSGTGIGLNLMADMNFWEALSFRVLVGLDGFDATGTVTDNSCSGSNDCETTISYLVVSAMARYAFLRKKSFNIWLGGGAGVLLPSSSESNSIDVDSISTTSAIIFGGGSDINMNKKLYIPFQVAYHLIPSSDDVTANYISIRAGVGYRF